MDRGAAVSFPVELLRCPISAQAMKPAPDDLVRSLQQLQSAGTLRNRSDELVAPFEGGLLCEDGAWFYPVRSGIPVMLAAEAVAATGSGGTLLTA
jgi:uncharacterized protein YbaR (Trm112 family)